MSTSIGHSMVICSLHCGHLWISVLVSICYKDVPLMREESYRDLQKDKDLTCN